MPIILARANKMAFLFKIKCRCNVREINLIEMREDFMHSTKSAFIVGPCGCCLFYVVINECRSDNIYTDIHTTMI